MVYKIETSFDLFPMKPQTPAFECATEDRPPSFIQYPGITADVGAIARRGATRAYNIFRCSICWVVRQIEELAATERNIQFRAVLEPENLHDLHLRLRNKRAFPFHRFPSCACG